MIESVIPVENTATIPREKYDFIKRMYAKDATDDEFEQFVFLANRYELRPELHEIWCVKYGHNPAQIFAGRDGILSIAHKTGKFDGMQTTPTFDEKGNIVSATCRVWRNDMTHEFVRTVYFKEYDQHRNLWLTKPVTMICKVAESQCLRLAFSISGLYDESEIDERTPIKYERESAIDIKPEEVPDTIKGWDYSMVESSKESYRCNNFDMSVFERAKLPNERYDDKMITEDFARQMKLKKENKTEEPPANKPETVQPIVVKTALEISQETKDSIHDMLKAYNEDIKKRMPEADSEPEPEEGKFVCEKCGKRFNSQPQADTSKMFASKILCKDCFSKR